jgi:hypothetical protein
VLLAAATVVSLPWLVPGLALGFEGAGSARLGLSLFRARADSPLGTTGSLLSLGGLWRTDLAPPGRSKGAWIPAFILMAWLAAWGWLALRRRWPRGSAAGLLGLAAIGLALAVAPSVSWGRSTVAWMDGAVGGAFLRDSQKFVFPLALLEATAFGMGVQRLLDAARGVTFGRALALLAPLLPVALAPTLAWGASGRLGAATYPPSWSRAEAIMRSDPSPGAVLVLPWHAYLPFRWNHGRTVHQPAPVYFSRPVVASSALEVGPETVPDEDPWAALARSAALSGRPLAGKLDGLGVRYVLVFREADWRQFAPEVNGLRTALDTGDLALYRAPPPRTVPTFRRPSPRLVIAFDVGAAAVLAAGAVWAAATGRRRRRSSGPTHS